MNRRRAISAIAGTALAALAAPTFSYAQSDEPITIVVPYGGGGSVDGVVRLVAEFMTQDLGRPVLVENKPGGNGIVGAQYVARANPDGLTLLSGGTGPVSLNVMLREDLPYSLDDFESVAMLFDGPLSLTINSSLPVNNVEEFVAWAKEQDRPMRYGTLGPGSVTHLFGLILGKEFDIPVVDVAYRNNPASLVDLLANQAELSFATPIALVEHVKAGKLKILALTTEERLEQFPDTPTLAEQGYPKLTASFWTALHAPKGTPQEMIEMINKSANKALADEAIAGRLAAEGLRVRSGPPSLLDEQLDADKALWGEIIEAENLSLN
ncbi:tripartite tricarboxylate transporter substrate binding protein [Mesorhizobium sp. CAU 1741]|uniref:tripartite tricarboxylate transporter substrate binding protein n=1 Tax=Mesorhizobium sp. CAU 1741 TaxID=3140366 RepID=UPI00325A71CD